MTLTVALKLLAIDDDAQNLEIIKVALKREGLEIMTAQDPEEGFELFLRTRPKIVLLDLVMPKVSGIELSGTYRKRGRWSRCHFDYCPLLRRVSRRSNSEGRCRLHD